MLVKLVKLCSSEEILGRHEADGQPLKDIRRLVVHPDGRGQMQMSIMPWIMHATDYELTQEWLDQFGMLILEAPKQIGDAYMQTVTGIALPSSILTQ